MHVINRSLVGCPTTWVLEQWVVIFRQHCGVTRFSPDAFIHTLLLAIELNDLNSGLYRFVTLLFLFDPLKVPRLDHHLPLLFSQLIGLEALVLKRETHRCA